MGLSLNYATANSVFIFAPSANYTLTLTNIPTTSNLVTTLTGIFSTKFYANAISINGSAVTMRASGGLSNLSVNASATRVLQSFVIANNSGTFEVRTAISSDF